MITNKLEEDRSRPASRRMSTVSHPHDETNQSNSNVHEASKVHFSDENFTLKKPSPTPVHKPSTRDDDFDSQTKF